MKKSLPVADARAQRQVPLGGSPAADPAALAARFKALADPTRVRILGLLAQKGVTCCELVSPRERGLCACDVEGAVGLSQAAVSHHMAILVRAGLVRAEKLGRWVFYRRDESELAALGKLLSGEV